MYRVLSCLTVEHDWRLVVLAIFVCFLASFTSIALFRWARNARDRWRSMWLLTAGTATGSGIWATHFIAMLAYEPGFGVAYSISLTVLSLAVAIAVTSAGLAVAAALPGSWSPPLGGALVGGGVASMHYTGMSALRVPGDIAWSADLVTVSVLLGIVLGAAALFVAVRGNSIRGTLVAALLLTLAIVSHHFTAMGAVELVLDPSRTVDAMSLSPVMLALAVAAVAGVVLLLSLICIVVEERFHDQRKRLDVALHNMRQGLLMFDERGKLVLTNRRFEEMYKLAPGSLKPGCT